MVSSARPFRNLNLFLSGQFYPEIRPMILKVTTSPAGYPYCLCVISLFKNHFPVKHN